MTVSCLVDQGDIAIVQGNNYPPAMWQFLVSENPDVLFDITGSVFKLRVTWPGGETIAKSSDVDAELVIDLPTSTLAWKYSTTQSRSMPLGRIARYELERWISGTQQSLIDGRFAVEAGTNPD